MLFLLLCVLSCILIALDGRRWERGIAIAHVARLQRILGALLVLAATLLSTTHESSANTSFAAFAALSSQFAVNDLVWMFAGGGILICIGVSIELGALMQQRLFAVTISTGKPSFESQSNDASVLRRRHVLGLVWWSVLGLIFVGSAVSHWHFYADADPQYSGWVAKAEGLDLVEPTACTGAILVKNFHKNSAAYRCAGRLGWVMGEWSSQPFMPWPGYVQGSSTALARELQAITGINRDGSGEQSTGGGARPDAPGGQQPLPMTPDDIDRRRVPELI